MDDSPALCIHPYLAYQLGRKLLCVVSAGHTAQPRALTGPRDWFGASLLAPGTLFPIMNGLL